MTAAIFKAAFSDWKLVKTRGAVQLIFEIPVENADLAYKVVGGMPDAARERWFAIARLNENGERSPSREARTDLGPDASGSASRPPNKESKAWDETSPAQQAGILCNEKSFHKFLEEYCGETWQDFGHLPDSNLAAAMSVRKLCQVATRADILPGTPAGTKWKELVSFYRTWMREPELVG